MATPTSPEETPRAHLVSEDAARQPPGPSPKPDSGALGAQARRAGRTLVFAGMMLTLLFFSPFVSCGMRTMTGLEAIPCK